MGARGGERHSFSSIANAFYGDGEMSAEEFERGDYDFGAAERFFADREQIRRNEILQQIENGEHRETLRASNLDAEGVEQYVAGKRREVAREVVERGDTRFALPDIDDITFSEYNEEKVIRADIARLQSEALTWDAKYRNTLRIRTLSNGFTYRYTIDDDGIVHVYDKEKAINMHEWREDYGNTDSTQFNSLAEEFGIGRRDNGVDSRFGKNGREQAEDDRRYNRSLRSEGRSDRAGYTEDRSYADGAQEVRERNTRNAPRKGERKRAIRYHFDEDGSGHGTVTYADGTSARFALPETDSEGMHLTKTQQEFFKDSKVRDSNGRLLVVYHGTPDGKFYEFSYGKAGKVGGSQHGYGFYFSDSERDAKLYTQGTGTIIKAHLNITNPIDAMGKDLSSGVGAILDRLPMYAKGNLREQYGDLETARRRFSKLDNGTMLSVLCSNTEMHPEVFNTILLNLGYDGIVYSEDGYATEYVAFKSSQAKETNNKKPTQHPDMRFALPFDDPFLDALYESDDTDVRSEVFDAAGIIAKGLPYDTGKVASVGEMRKLQANYTKDRVYSKKDALGVVSRFEDADVLKPKSRAERVGKDAIFKVRGFPRYNSKVIKIEPTGGQFRISSSSSRPGVGSINSISDLYELVKAFGKDFSVEKEQGLTNQARRGILLLSRRQFGSKPQLKWR